jgi:hypothetical protein
MAATNFRDIDETKAVEAIGNSGAASDTGDLSGALQSRDEHVEMHSVDALDRSSGRPTRANHRH